MEENSMWLPVPLLSPHPLCPKSRGDGEQKVNAMAPIVPVVRKLSSEDSLRAARESLSQALRVYP